MIWFGKKRNLSHRYVSPYKNLKCIEEVSYEMDFQVSWVRFTQYFMFVHLRSVIPLERLGVEKSFFKKRFWYRS